MAFKRCFAEKLLILFSIAQCLSFCISGGPKCAKTETQGRFFRRVTINKTDDVSRAVAPHIYGCRHLCRELFGCVGLSYSSNASVEFPCQLHNGTDLHRFLLPDVNSSTILLHEPKSCNNETIVDGGWTSWEDDPPCPSPCRRVVVRQKRSCVNPRHHSKCESCSERAERFRPCEVGECLDITALHALPILPIDGYEYANISSRRVALTFYGAQWLGIQSRIDGSVDFNRSWVDYKYGFGDVDGEFWLGNEHIHQLTEHIGAVGPKLRIHLQYRTESYTPIYSDFSVADETYSYRMTYGSRDTGDDGIVSEGSLKCQKDRKFSTYDKDNDKSSRNCAQVFSSGWWFNACFCCNLNGPYRNTTLPMIELAGIHWKGWKGDFKSLTRTQMGISFPSSSPP